MNQIIKLDFQNFWHVGSGRGAGHYVDAVPLKDNHDLPLVSGKQLKGLLRHAVHRAENWGWYKEIELPTGPIRSFEELLFGSRSQDETRHQTTMGMLFIESAQLAEREYQFLQQEEQASLKQFLYQELYNTAIDVDTGTAVEHSLRGIEVVLPITLFSAIELKVTALDADIQAQQKQFLESKSWAIIKKALPLIDSIGAHRSRGLGEVIVTLSADY